MQGQIQGLPVPSLRIWFAAYCFSCEWLDCVYVPEVGLLCNCRPKHSFCEVSTALWWFFSPTYCTEPVSATWVCTAIYPRSWSKWLNSSTCCRRFSTLATLFIRGEQIDQLGQLYVNIKSQIYSFGSIYKMYAKISITSWGKSCLTEGIRGVVAH